MKVVMVAVMSEDGFITRGSNANPWEWTSEEDKVWYVNMVHSHDLYLMGSRTYSVLRHNLPAHAHKIVMSHNVNEQGVVPNVTFSDKSFTELLQFFSARYSEVLVLGGATTYHQLLEQRLIDEAYITVEPQQFHTGVQLADSPMYFEHKGFTLIEKRPLNDQGTVLKHYLLKK